MENVNVEKKFNVELDYKGYLIDPNSYSEVPSPLFGTRFATGRPSYHSLDLWQVGGLTDFSKGCGQEYLVDPSRFDHSEGIDISTPGEFKLEREVSDLSGFPTQYGKITCRYKSNGALFLGTDEGKILYSTNGSSFYLYQDTGTGKIYQIIETDNGLLATKGFYNSWLMTTLRSRLSNVYQTNTGLGFGSKNKVGQTMIFNQSVKVRMVQVRLKAKPGVPKGEIKLAFYATDTQHKPVGDPLGIARYSAIENENFEWKTFWFSSPLYLDSSTEYAMVLYSDAGEPITYYAEIKQSQLQNFYRLYFDGQDWSISSSESLIFELFDNGTQSQWLDTRVSNLFYVKDAGYYYYGLFNDGIRQSTNCFVWLPEPPDPLWKLPAGENFTYAISIPRGFLIGTWKSIWLFTSGASAICLMHDPANVSEEHMKNCDVFGQYAIFGIEGRGLFYSAGTSINPTNLTIDSWTAKVTKVRGVVRAGNCIYANVYHSKLGKWFFAKCCMTYTSVPDSWYFVKALEKEPVNLSMFNERNILIHYADKTCSIYDAKEGQFQFSGYFVTSRIDENLIRLQKFYRSISVATKIFPANTSVSLAYSIDDNPPVEYEETSSDGTLKEVERIFPNPTLGNTLKIYVKLKPYGGNKTPVVTDVMWKYFLERPRNETVKKLFNFIVIATENMEALDGSKYPLSKREIEESLWSTKAKKEILNFVSPNNIKTPAIIISHDSGRYLTIDQTNNKLTVSDGSSIEHSLDLKGKTLSDVVTAISNWSGYSASLHLEASEDTPATKLMPIKDFYFQKEKVIYTGTDIYSVIWTEQSPQHRFLSLEGYGQSKLAISLREV